MVEAHAEFRDRETILRGRGSKGQHEQGAKGLDHLLLLNCY